MANDLAVRLWRDGYAALPRLRRGSAGGDAFETGLAGRRAVVVRGRRGARLFYDNDLVARRGAVPPPVADLLFGRGAVHGLDGGAHRERKDMFLDVLAPGRIAPLIRQISPDLQSRAAAWTGPVRVFHELVETYGGAVLPWAGVDLPPARRAHVSHRLAAIVDGFGGAPLAYPRGWAARLWADRWARRLVEQARSGALTPPPGSALAAVAEADLPPRVAAVELLNVVRPTVAVAWHGTFAALELWRHPLARSRIASTDGTESTAYVRAFVHEVRRLSPFVPVLAGRAVGRATIDGVAIRPGDLIVLDVDGTNRDPHGWERAEDFEPERFLDVEPDEYGFVPQGGGSPASGHRCPGEPLTVGILAATVKALAGIEYDVVSEPRYDVSRMPTLPAAGLVVRRR